MPSGGAGPQGSGQGRELIERALPYQLGAKTAHVLEADGGKPINIARITAALGAAIHA